MKFLLILFIIMLLALDWAALDDLNTGNEPDKRGEVAMVVASVPLLLVFGKKLLKSHERGQT